MMDVDEGIPAQNKPSKNQISLSMRERSQNGSRQHNMAQKNQKSVV